MIWDGLCPLAFQDLTIPWSNNIYAVDASEWGLGVCVCQAMVSTKRWRFQDEEA